MGVKAVFSFSSLTMGTVGHFTLRQGTARASAGSTACIKPVSTSYHHVTARSIRTPSAGRLPRRLASVVVNVAEVRLPVPASTAAFYLLSVRVHVLLQVSSHVSSASGSSERIVQIQNGQCACFRSVHCYAAIIFTMRLIKKFPFSA